MPQIEFEGDFSPDEIQAIAQALAIELQTLQKSVGIGDGESIPEDLVPPTIAADPGPSKSLLQLWQAGGGQLLGKGEDECGRDRTMAWDVYDLQKAEIFPGAIKRGKDGSRYVLNHNRRWVRQGGADNGGINPGAFDFPESWGDFGRGVYLPVYPQTTGYIRLRARIDCNAQQFISADEFYDLEADLTENLELILDGRGVRCIGVTEGDRITQLIVRDNRWIEPLGVIANSGEVPTGRPEFRIVQYRQDPDAVVVDIEFADQGGDLLAKSLQSESYLHGSPLVPVSESKLDRVLVRNAIARLRLDGVPIDQVVVRCLDGRPDFLPDCCAFCLPSDGVINLLPHSPQAAIQSLVRELSDRLAIAVQSGVPADSALKVAAQAANLDPQWWLEIILKRYCGSILIQRAGGIDAPQFRPYLNMLAGRGLRFWGDRRTVAECFAEDYRCAFDPAGLPNLVTLEWDLLAPGYSRLCCQQLLNSLGDEA